jgi:hypothetical protein
VCRPKQEVADLVREGTGENDVFSHTQRVGRFTNAIDEQGNVMGCLDSGQKSCAARLI